MSKGTSWNYGDEVLVAIPSATCSAHVRAGVIVEITEVNNQTLAQIVGATEGTLAYSVEFPDGSDVLIPENYLLPIRLGSA